jgi:hypothetical protein
LPRQWDFYDGFQAHLVGGIATRYQLTNFYMFTCYAIAPAFQWAQKNMPHVLVIGWVTNFLYAICYGTIGVMLWNLIANKTLKNLSLILSIIFIIIMPTLFTPSFTGNSFILCGASLLGAYLLFNKKSLSIISILLFVLAIAGYLLSYFWRQDSAMGASLIIGIFILIDAKQKIKSFFFLVPFAIAGSAIVYFAYTSLDDIPFLQQIEGAMFYVADGGMDEDLLHGVSEKDSMKIKAVERFFINDENEINTALVYTMLQMKINNESTKSLLKKILHAWQVGEKTIIKNLFYVLLNLLFVVLAILSGYRNKLHLVLFQLLFCTTVFLVAYTVKLEDRHYIYMAQLYSFCNLFFLLPVYNGKFKKISLAIVALIAAFTLRNELIGASSYYQEARNLQITETEVNAVAHNKILLLDGESKSIFYGSPLQIHRFDSVKTIAYYDMGEMALIPQYTSFLNKLCNCNSRSVVDFYAAIGKMGDSVIVIAPDERMEFIQSYLKIVHNKTIIYRKIEGNFFLHNISSDKLPLYYFRIIGVV